MTTPMKKLLCRLMLVPLLALSGLFSAVAADKTPTNPFNITQFKASKENKALYGDYRKKWLRLTGFELSSLHWNQFVAVFINQNPEIYRVNYLEYLRTSQDDYDDDDDDEEEEDEDAPVKNNFKTYAIGTMVAKEGYTSHQGKPGLPTFLVMMKKHPKGYDDNNGNWEYMKFSTDGQTLLRGKASQPQVQIECAGCHVNVADRDYIFGTFYSGAIRH